MPNRAIAGSSCRLGTVLVPGTVDGEGIAGVLDIDEEHLAIGREGYSGELGGVHGVVREAVELALGRHADQFVAAATVLADDEIAEG